MLSAHLLEVLRELLPKAATIGVLANPDMPSTETDTSNLQEAARTLRLQLVVQSAKTAREIETAFATLVERRVGGLVVISDPSTPTAVSNSSHLRRATHCRLFSSSATSRRLAA